PWSAAGPLASLLQGHLTEAGQGASRGPVGPPSVLQGSLFEDRGFRERLTESLARLARDRIYIGTSSWKYEGWLDQIYTRSNYLHHGRFSKRAFEAECLSEYATRFPTVCGDFAFYQFPTEEF